jgi:hypothetical protein
VAPKRAASLGESGLSEQYRRDIEAALPRGVTVSGDFWDKLWAILVHYDLQRNRNSLATRAKQWQRFEKQLPQRRDLIAIRRTMPVRDPPPPWWIELLRAVEAARWSASQHSQHYQKAAAGFHGRSNPPRQRLYRDILLLWRAHLKQPLRRSRTHAGKPGGPLIRFFTACVGPILGDTTPSVHGIRKIIEQARARQDMPL